MRLFEITTESTEESCVRAYAWAMDENRARNAFRQSHPGSPIQEVKCLMNDSDNEFVTELSASGFSEVRVEQPA